MHIAFISYEYPPDTADGGIATYVQEASRLLRRRGHEVEVFAGSREREGLTEQEGVRIYRTLASTRDVFSEQVAPIFTARHHSAPFDVMEGADFRAEARFARRAVPQVPLVVRLHTPQFLVHRVRDLHQHGPLRDRMRRRALRHGEKPRWNPYSREHDAERLWLLEADEVVGISRSITEMMTRLWHLPPERICRIPNPYTPSAALLQIPIETDTRTVTYLGRLESRKGALEMAAAIPLVLHRFPAARFRFVGRASPISPRHALDMRAYLEARLQAERHAVEFVGHVPLEQVPLILAQTDLCVFPSWWENFPYVCLEAMAAGRGVVGSRAGGMREMLDEGNAGEVVMPGNPHRIARAILRLLEDPERRMRLGTAARARLQTEYCAERIGPMMEASYLRAIRRKQ